MANLKEEYTQHILNTAPDMDKLWDRISNEIDRKETADNNEEEHTKKREQIKRSGGYMKVAAAAAAFIVIFAGVNIMNESKKQKDLMNNIPTSRTEKAAAADKADEAAADTEMKKGDNDDLDLEFYINDKTAEEKTEETDDAMEAAMGEEAAEQKIRYDQLAFNETDTVSFKASYIPSGNEYFVEKDVLSQTDCFADVIVIGADLSEDGGAEYSLMVNAVYDRDGSCIMDSGTLFIHSNTPYILQENRQYLLPLKQGASDRQYSIVFENAPQIEFTLDGGAVFQNGWSSLDNNSKALEKDSLNVNDFYFDRMRYLPEFDISMLLTEWKNA